MPKCPNAKKLGNVDFIYCTLYQNYCYLDEPNEKLCNEMYGDPYQVNKSSDYEDDPDDGNPDSLDAIIDDEIGVDDIGD